MKSLFFSAPILGAMLMLSACADGFMTPGIHDRGLPEYVLVEVGCVGENPAKDGSVAFGPGWTKTSVVVFKQKNKDGTVSPPNATPENCK